MGLFTAQGLLIQHTRFDVNGPAASGILERCAAPRAGIAADINTGVACADLMDEGTPSISRGTGPWSAYYFVSRHNTSVDVRFQVNKMYRRTNTKTWINGDLEDDCEDDDAMNVRQNEYTANGLACARANGYFSAQANLIAHEREHVTLARNEWQLLDLFEGIEAVNATSSAGARNIAEGLITRAHTRMKNAANNHTYTGVSYRFFLRENGSLWEFLTITFTNH